MGFSAVVLIVVGLAAFQISGWVLGGEEGARNEVRLRLKRDAGGAEPARGGKDDSECADNDMLGGMMESSPTHECCSCNDCELPEIKGAVVDKCEAMLIAETERAGATSSSNGTNGGPTPQMTPKAQPVAGPTNSTNSNSSKIPSDSAQANINAIRGEVMESLLIVDTREIGGTFLAYYETEVEDECMTECVFNESGYLTSNLQLNESALMKDITEGFKDPKWAPIVQKAFSKCMEYAKKGASQKQKCKSGADDFVLCMTREKYLSCPEDSWNKNDADCQKIKEKLTKCPNMAPPY